MSEEAFQVAILIAAAVVVILLIVVALPVVLSMRHAARDREFQHAERLKALEMGRSLPGDPMHPGSYRSAGMGIGVWVPIAALVLALAASITSNGSETAVAFAWVSAGSVGVTGVICGTILALRGPIREDESNAPYFPAKPSSEDVEFDIVSRRGA
jgi:hypothetical protein